MASLWRLLARCCASIDSRSAYSQAAHRLSRDNIECARHAYSLAPTTLESLASLDASFSHDVHQNTLPSSSGHRRAGVAARSQPTATFSPSPQRCLSARPSTRSRSPRSWRRVSSATCSSSQRSTSLREGRSFSSQKYTQRRDEVGEPAANSRPRSSSSSSLGAALKRRARVWSSTCNAALPEQWTTNSVERGFNVDAGTTETLFNDHHTTLNVLAFVGAAIRATSLSLARSC